MAGLVNSKRSFQVAFTKPNSNLIDKWDFAMDEILYDNVEDFKNYEIDGMDKVIMTLRKNIDEVMDLKIGETVFYKRGSFDADKYTMIVIRTTQKIFIFMSKILNEEEVKKFKRLSGLDEANKTPCQTPESVYNITVKDNEIKCSVKLPMDLDLSEEDAKILETNVHNAMELVLSGYFKKTE